MYIAMDMGTTNTRAWLCDNDRAIIIKKGAFGARLGATEGRCVLFERLRALLLELLTENELTERDIECILCSGMAGSEIGLCEIPHISLPCDINGLAKSITEKSIPEITAIPFSFVPGLKKACENELSDIMRGEETESFGIIQSLQKGSPVILVLPGTHNKIIRISENGMIEDFSSSASGELADIIISHSILTGSVSHNFSLSESYAKSGMDYANENGLNAAIFRVRVMGKNGIDRDSLSSFLYGAVLGQDIKLIKKYSNAGPVYVGGNEALKSAYCALLDSDNTIPLDKNIASTATLTGLQKIYCIYKERKV